MDGKWGFPLWVSRLVTRYGSPMQKSASISVNFLFLAEISNIYASKPIFHWIVSYGLSVDCRSTKESNETQFIPVGQKKTRKYAEIEARAWGTRSLLLVAKPKEEPSIIYPIPIHLLLFYKNNFQMAPPTAHPTHHTTIETQLNYLSHFACMSYKCYVCMNCMSYVRRKAKRCICERPTSTHFDWNWIKDR